MTWFRRDKQIDRIKISENDELADVVKKAVDVINSKI